MVLGTEEEQEVGQATRKKTELGALDHFHFLRWAFYSPRQLGDLGALTLFLPPTQSAVTMIVNMHD